MEEEELEASILQNFLLMQADKHGHHLLAKLPAILASGTDQDSKVGSVRRWYTMFQNSCIADYSDSVI